MGYNSPVSTLPHPSVLDLVAVGFIVMNARVGYRRAVPGESLKLIALIPACLVFAMTVQPVSRFASRFNALGIPAESRPAIGLISTAIVSLIVLAIFRRIISSFLHPPSPRHKAKVGNMIAATVYAALFVLLTWGAMGLLPVQELNDRFTRDSIIGRSMASALPALKSRISSKGESSRRSNPPAASSKRSVFGTFREGQNSRTDIPQ